MSADTVELVRRIVDVTDAQLELVEAMEPLEAFSQGVALAALSILSAHEHERQALNRFINDLQGERQ